MTEEQALQFLKQALVTRAGLSLDDCAAAVQAWNVVAEAIHKDRVAEAVKESKEKHGANETPKRANS